MSIDVTCACGKTLRAPEEYAGKRVKCGACGGRVEVPIAGLGIVVDQDEGEPTPAPAPPPVPKAAQYADPTKPFAPNFNLPDPPPEVPPIEFARSLLQAMAWFSALMFAVAMANGAGADRPSLAWLFTGGVSWIALTVALAGLAASRR